MPRIDGELSSDESSTVSSEDYTRYRPLLFRALAALGRTGYVVPLDEGLELIHDFFIDAWPGLHQRYVPSKGAFSTYVFGAFIRFARTRIVRRYKCHERFIAVEPDDLAALGRVEPSGTERDLALVKQGLSQLPSEDRTVLEVWLANGSSERHVARSLGVSRYKARQRLVAALTRFAVAIGQQIGPSSSDWHVARLLWGEDRSVADTAAALGLTTAQVRLARSRVYDSLSRAFDER